MIKRSLIQLLFISGFCLLLTGCLSVKYAPRAQYLLNIHTPRAAKPSYHKTVIFVDRINVAQAFSNASFLYRVSANQYLIDYYHTFLAPISEQLYPILVNYLQKSGKFQPISSDDTLHPKVELRVAVLKLYADYRDPNCPRAVVSMRFTLLKWRNGKLFKPKNGAAAVLFSGTYTRRLPLKVKDTQSLLHAWQDGMHSIFSCAIRDLKRISQ